MTFQEATNLKSTLNPFSKKNIDFIWMITPLKSEDLNSYVNYYFTTDAIIFDEDSKKYSTDEAFNVWYFPKK